VHQSWCEAVHSCSRGDRRKRAADS
jgi:hypothetical protein